VIGRRGVDDGHFSKPRAIEIDPADRLYVVDMTGRIQVLENNGEFVRTWRTPEIVNGKPCGLGFSRDGLLMVADTHYFRILFYQTDGTPVPERTIGGVNGRGPGEFGFVTDVVQDADGNYFVSEYGDFDRIQKFDAQGRFVCQWGGHGSEPGQFLRPQALALDPAGQLWVADACNHRLQLFDTRETPPKLIRVIGREGIGPGEFRYPYGLWLANDGSVVVAEFGNHRIQKLTPAGESLAMLGSPGRLPGQFHQPWSVALDSQGNVFALDSYNHRLQRFRFPLPGTLGNPVTAENPQAQELEPAGAAGRGHNKESF
jgi:sugar lactone lactonase YvrE